MKWNIVVDSSSDLLSENQKGEIGLSIVPLTLNIGENSFVDDKDINVGNLLKAMKEEKNVLNSACPSPQDFYQEFEKADFTICITMTSALSGTFNSARLGAQILAEDYPDKKVLIVDSKATAGKIVIIKNKAESLINEGKTFEEISEILPKYAEKICFVFALGAYDNLIKTGRMSKTSGLIASKLGIRAVSVAGETGTFDVLKKPKGEKNAVKEMVEFAKNNRKLDDSIVITHCNNLEGALFLKEKIIEEINPKAIEILECRGLTTFYTMEKGLLLAF